MSEIYRFIFGAPRPGPVAMPARWTSNREGLGAGGTATKFEFTATNRGVNLNPRTYVEVDINVPAAAGDPQATGITGSANIVILSPKWPVPCEAALQIELGHNLDSWRKLFSYSPYLAGAGVPDFASRKLRIRYTASGQLTVTGNVPELKYDLPALSAPADDQQLHVVVIPQPNQLDPKIRGSVAQIKIDGGEIITVTG